MNNLDKKINEIFAGVVVRKDLVGTLKKNAAVPSYVLEYLLGQYCATNEETSIQTGIKTVQSILEEHYVNKNKAGYYQSCIERKGGGKYKIIDKVHVVFDAKNDIYKASFENLGIDGVQIAAEIANERYPKLLVTSIWCLASISYQYSDNPKDCPWILEDIKPIQLSHFDLDDFKEKRKAFTKNEWIDLLIQTIGFNPEMMSERNKIFQLVRLIPYCERNYNLIELGPKGTGKSHTYIEFSPNGILLSGGNVSEAKLFGSNAKKHDPGLLGHWDNIAFDEFAGSKKTATQGLVDGIQNYAANKTYNRGKSQETSLASMTFVGNTKHNVPYMLKHSHLLEELPTQYLKSAFIDRLHFYIPGWEIDIITPEQYTNGYGFVVDYYAAALEKLREYDYSNDFTEYFALSNISTRDQDGVMKTFSGLMKIIYPNRDATPEEIEELLKIAMEGRKRVKDTILRIDNTFKPVDFSYINLQTNEKFSVKTLEEIRYANVYYKSYSDEPNNEKDNTNNNITNTIVENSTTKQEELKNKKIIVEEGQIGFTFDKLFASYIKGATHLIVTDPYIVGFYQMVNFMEFLDVVENIKDETEVIQVDLITSEDDHLMNKQIENLNTIRESCLQMGIEFNYRFAKSIHARSIVTNTDWTISLDRGFDVFQNCERKDVFQYTTRKQKYRPCRRFEITYLKQDNTYDIALQTLKNIE